VSFFLFIQSFSVIYSHSLILTHSLTHSFINQPRQRVRVGRHAALSYAMMRVLQRRRRYRYRSTLLHAVTTSNYRQIYAQTRTDKKRVRGGIYILQRVLWFSWIIFF